MRASHDQCPFCDVSDRAILCESKHAFAIFDVFPVSPGHALVIPRHHVADVFDLSERDFAEVFALVGRVRNQLMAEFSPSGFNVGVNIGRDAGQTVMHAHVHIIPRYTGDIADPTGGVRNVLPGQGHYSPDEPPSQT